MASWLNVFVRQADIVEIACIAQSVNVISPLITRWVISNCDRIKLIAMRSPTGLFRQTIYWPLYLFSRYMRGGVSVSVSINSPKFSGETLPPWISSVKGLPKELDASATLHVSAAGQKSIRIAIVNRSGKNSYTVPLRIAFTEPPKEVEVHELWHEDVRARNGWGKENEVSVKTWRAPWAGEWVFREHSFTLLVVDIV